MYGGTLVVEQGVLGFLPMVSGDTVFQWRLRPPGDHWDDLGLTLKGPAP